MKEIDYNKNIQLHIKVQNKPEEWRLGQAYFNYAEELYPEGYDLNQLFVSFKRRKCERDIERGSKKALKKLRKEKDIIFEE